MDSVILEQGTFLTRYVRKTATDVLPRRFKRLIYLGSVLGLMLNAKTADKGMLERINRKLKLAHDETAILFPIYIHRSIWKQYKETPVPIGQGTIYLNNLSEHELCDRDCWCMSAYLVKHSPPWLHYGSDQLMVSDIHDVLVEVHPVTVH